MATAELESPAATTAEAAPQTATPATSPAPSPEANGQATAKPDRPRGEGGKFRARDAVERFEARKAQRESKEKPAATAPEAPAAVEKPAETKPAEAAKPAIDPAVLKRAEAAGLTEYQAKKLGDKLEGEITKRTQAAEAKAREEAAKAQPAPAPQPTAQQKPTEAAKQPASNPLASLPDLPAEYGADIVERDKLLRNALQQAFDVIGELRNTSQEEISRLQEGLRQDEQRREAEALAARGRAFDSAIDKLGSDFVPVFGRGTIEEVTGSPYAQARQEAFVVSDMLRQLRPELNDEQAAQAASFALYPDLYEAHVERIVAERLRKSGAGITPGPGSNGGLAAGYTGPVAKHPHVQQTIQRIQQKQQGFA
jgi:hypothetical protein